MKKIIVSIIILIAVVIAIVAIAITKNTSNNTIPYEEMPQENVNVKEPTSMKQV